MTITWMSAATHLVPTAQQVLPDHVHVSFDTAHIRKEKVGNESNLSLPTCLRDAERRRRRLPFLGVALGVNEQRMECVRSRRWDAA